MRKTIIKIVKIMGLMIYIQGVLNNVLISKLANYCCIRDSLGWRRLKCSLSISYSLLHTSKHLMTLLNSKIKSD